MKIYDILTDVVAGENKSPLFDETQYTPDVRKDRQKVLLKGFNPESSDYDYLNAEKAGILPEMTGRNKGHMGSVAPVTSEIYEQYKKHGLPSGEAYIVLKGANHPTHKYLVEGEAERGFEIKKYGDRYFSVPKNQNSIRPDGTMKGSGFLGGMKRLDDPSGVSSEISIGVDWGTGEKLIPTMVPTLDDNELKYLLSTPEDKLNSVNPDLNKSITRKAVEFAKQRESQGLPFFAQPDESPKSPRVISGENKNEFIQKFIEEKQIIPKFNLTPEQEKSIAGMQYGKIKDKTPLKQNFLARIIAGDESVGTITPMQKRWADWLKTQLPKE